MVQPSDSKLVLHFLVLHTFMCSLFIKPTSFLDNISFSLAFVSQVLFETSAVTASPNKILAG